MGQGIIPKELSIKEGVWQGLVSDIFQDKDGFIWFAAKDGLHRYDGYYLKTFTNDSQNPFSILGNQILKIFEDKRGLLWVSIENEGISILNKKSFVNFFDFILCAC